MITSLLIVSGIWLALVVIANQLLSIRAHTMLGHQYLQYAAEVFREEGMSSQAQNIDYSMIPMLTNIRFSISARLFWVVLTMVLILVLMMSVVVGENVFWINTASGIGVGYAVISLLRAYTLRETVDSTCEACNADLNKIDHYNGIDTVLDYNASNDS